MSRRLLLLASLLSAASAQAGVNINLEMKHEGKLSQLNIQVEGQNARMEATDPEGAPEDAIVHDGTKKRLLIIKYKEKAYNEINEQEIKKMAGEMGDMMKQLKAQIAALPPDQRAKAEAAMKQQGQMMKGLSAAVPEEKYVRSSGTKRIAGYSCDLYSVQEDGKHVADTCLIPWSDLKFDGVPLKQSLEVFQDGTIFGGSNTPLKAWGTSIGLPAWRRTVPEPGEQVTETTLKSIRSGAVSRSSFEPPAGFKKQRD